MGPKLPVIVTASLAALFLVGILIPSSFFLSGARLPGLGLGISVLAASFGDVVINEIAWMGSSVSTADEWLELRNLTSFPINFADTPWSVYKNDLSMPVIDDGILEANGYFLISNNGEDHVFAGGESILNVLPDLINLAVSLPNSSVQYKLYDAADHSGNLIDAADDGVGDPAAGNNQTSSNPEPNASMARKDPLGDGTEADSWYTSTASVGFDLGTTEKGTPGSENIDIPDEVAPEEVTNLRTVVGNKEVTLSWVASDSADVSGYKLYVDSSSGFGDAQDLGSVTGYTVTGLTNETTHTFKITTYDTSSNESSGVTVEATPTDGISVGGLLINEVAFREGNDWIELRAMKAADYEGYRVFEGGTSIATIPAWGTLDSGDYIILHKEEGANDSQKSDNNSGYWDIYGMGGLTATDNSLTIIKPAAKVRIDALIWSNDDGKFTKSRSEAGALVVEGQWDTGSNFEDSDKDAWTDSDNIKEGGSLARDIFSTDTNSRVDWQRTTTQTPGRENEITEDSGDGEDDVFEGTIAGIKDLVLGTKVKVRGFVTAPPGVFGDDVFYLRDDPPAGARAGIRVVYYTSVLSLGVGLGDEVELGCELAEAYDELYIKMGDDSSLVVVGSGLPGPGPVEVGTGGINEDCEGRLVELSGEIVETSGSTFWIDDGSGRAKIYVKDSTGIDTPYKRVGYEAEVVGIVSQWGFLKDGSPNYRVLPRFQDDLKIAAPKEGTVEEGLAGAEEEILGVSALPVTGASGLQLLMTEVLLCLGAALRLFLYVQKEKTRTRNLVGSFCSAVLA